MNIDTIILAGGRGSRLRGVVPAYYKPLLVIDGQALIVSTIRQVRRCANGRVIVVVAPDNASPIANLLDDACELDANTFLIVQPQPDGPGAAFLLGAELALTEHVLLLMADNVFGPKDIYNVIKGHVEHRHVDVVIGVNRINDPEVARNFTRVTPTCTYEGPIIDDAQRVDSDFHVWLGPLLVNKRKLAAEIGPSEYEGELKIGPWLSNVGSITTVHCETHDVGDPMGLNGG